MSTLNLTPDPEPENTVPDESTMERAVKSGANWFYWIAGLSLVNSIIFLFGGSWNFLAGLAATQIVDGLVVGATGTNELSAVRIVALLLDIGIAAIFAACGIFAGKAEIWAFAVGMILYTLDGIIFVLFGDLFPAGFHLFALFMIFRGLAAARKLNNARVAVKSV